MKKAIKVTKIIFLDFDGVIVTPKTKFQHFDRDCMEHLKSIIKETDAFIVISSSWKIGNTFRALRAMFEPFGLFDKVIGMTPNKVVEWGRGNEIDEWLMNPKMSSELDMALENLERFIILDDDSDMEPHMDKLVQTEWDVGLTKEICDEAIKRLNNP